jgi:hypothetical protein
VSDGEDEIVSEGAIQAAEGKSWMRGESAGNPYHGIRIERDWIIPFLRGIAILNPILYFLKTGGDLMKTGDCSGVGVGNQSKRGPRTVDKLRRLSVS